MVYFNSVTTILRLDIRPLEANLDFRMLKLNQEIERLSADLQKRLQHLEMSADALIGGLT